MIKLPKNIKKAKYRVETSCGDHSVGEIIDCYVLMREGHVALVYLPKIKRKRCGCIVLCCKAGTCWIEQNDWSFINRGTGLKPFLEILTSLDNNDNTLLR